MMSNATQIIPTALPPIPPNIAQIAAPVLIGILVSWGFWGVLVVQVYIYSILFRDKVLIQCFGNLYGLRYRHLQTILTAVDAYYWFASGFGDLTHLGNVYLSFFDIPMLGSVLAILGQTFLCYRIYVLSGGNKWLSMLLFAICFMSLVGAWFSAIRGHVLAGGIATAQATVNTSALYVWLISAVLGDTGITAAMTYLLLRARGQYKGRDVVLNRLVILTMETNGVSATLAILTLGKCYANALLVTLNNRQFLLSKAQSTENTIAVGSIQFGQSNSRILSNLNSLTSTLGDTASTPGEYLLSVGISISTSKSTSKGESYQLDRVEA